MTWQLGRRRSFRHETWLPGWSPTVAGCIGALIATPTITGTSASALGFVAPKPFHFATEQSRPTPVAVFGEDGRRELSPRLSTLRDRIGLLFTDDAKTACTAFCVGDRTIATAAHCLFRPTGERRANLSAFRFALKDKKSIPASRLAGHRSKTVAQHVLAGGLALRVAPPIDASRDWALARLDKPLCAHRALPLEAKTPRQIQALARASRLFQVSFHRDFGNLTLAEATDCQPGRKLTDARRSSIEHDFSAPEHLVLHHCDTGGASSGSPLLVTRDDGTMAAVAINVGTYVQTPLMMREGKVVHRFKAEAFANTAVTTASFLQALDVFKNSQILSASEDMRRLQTGLAALGLYRGRIDGAYGPQTRNAIIDFELARRAFPTGLATATTLAAVASGTDPTRTDAVDPAAHAASNLEIGTNRPSMDRLETNPFGDPSRR